MENESIASLKISFVYGKNKNATGSDLGSVNSITIKQAGLQYGLVNLVDGGFTGFQLSFVNLSVSNFEELQ